MLTTSIVKLYTTAVERFALDLRLTDPTVDVCLLRDIRLLSAHV